MIGGFDDFFAGEIQHAAVERLQADADLLLGDGGGHGEESEGAGAGWTWAATGENPGGLRKPLTGCLVAVKLRRKFCRRY